MYERGIATPTALACIAVGEKSPGRLGATRHQLDEYVAVTVPHGNATKIVTVYRDKPKHIGAAYEPRRRTRDPTCSVIL